MEDLHGQRGGADLDFGVHERVRHRVVVMRDLDVVVDVHAGDLPLAVDKGGGRERAQGRPIQPGEQRVPAGVVVAHAAGVQLNQQLGDPGVQGRQREEALVPEPGEDPAFGDLHGHFDLGLVAGRRRPGGEDRRAVMCSELLVGALEPRLIAARERDPGLQLITHESGGDAAEEGEHPRVTPEPVGELLGGRGLGVGVVAGPQDADEEFDLDDLARRRVDDRRLLPGVIDEDLLAGPVLLAHREPMAGEPLAVVVAEPGVAVAVGVLLEILEVQQFQGDAGLLPLGVEVRAIGDGAAAPAGRRHAVETGLQDVVGELLDLLPVQPRVGRPAEDAGHGPDADIETGGHLPVAAGQRPLLAENLADLAHG
jgi:hypothetical protein